MATLRPFWFIIKTEDGLYARPTPKNVLSFSMRRDKAGLFDNVEAALAKIKQYCAANRMPVSRFRILIVTSAVAKSIPVMAVQDGVDLIEEEATEPASHHTHDSALSAAFLALRAVSLFKQVKTTDKSTEELFSEIGKAIIEEVVRPNIDLPKHEIQDKVEAAMQDWGAAEHCYVTHIVINYNGDFSVYFDTNTSSAPVRSEYFYDARPGNADYIFDAESTFRRDRFRGHLGSHIPLWLWWAMMFEDYPYKPYQSNISGRIFIYDTLFGEEIPPDMEPLVDTYGVDNINGRKLSIYTDRPIRRWLPAEITDDPNYPYQETRHEDGRTTYTRRPGVQFTSYQLKARAVASTVDWPSIISGTQLNMYRDLWANAAITTQTTPPDITLIPPPEIPQ